MKFSLDEELRNADGGVGYCSGPEMMIEFNLPLVLA